MGPILVEDLDDVAVGRRIHQLKQIGARRQEMNAYTGDLHRRAECYRSAVVPFIGCCRRYQECTGHDNTK